MSDMMLLDLETTGDDPEKDRIVQLGLGFDLGPMVEPEGGAVLIDPQMPISEGATEVHGISDEDVEGCPTFPELAHRVDAVLRENDYVVTYSGTTFDIPILDRELKRSGFPGVEDTEITEIDLYAVWCALEPRNLETAAKRFAGDPDFDPHDAWEDARILGDVYRGLTGAFQEQFEGEENLVPEVMAELTWPEDRVDRFGYFEMNDDGVVVFAFSGNKGDPVHDHPGMVDWMEGKDFPETVMEIARREVGR